MSSKTQTDKEKSLQLFSQISRQAVGLDVTYTLATGENTRRVYLDSTASTLQLKVVQDAMARYQPYYSNTHSVLHFGAKLSTEEYKWTHEMVLEFVNACPQDYTAFYVGSGTTAGINRVARTLRDKRPDRDVVITSIMEHHSNDLPHRKHSGEVVHVPAAMTATSIGQVNLERLEEALIEYGDRVNYVAITGVSNVTGIVNPIAKIASMAHRHGALIVVDAAQMAAHLPIKMSGHENTLEDIDVLIFSGHKIYAPGSPGVVVTRKDLFSGLEPQEVGGGMVDDVYLNRYTTLENFPDREEAGTPNINGAIGLAASLYALSRVGMDTIAKIEEEIVDYALEKLSHYSEIAIYGEADCHKCERAGAISFNIKKVEHGLTAAILNDYFNVSVRNECFCAHPYVREMITEALANDDDLTDEELEEFTELHKGMVRASFGIYNTKEDVDIMVKALSDIIERREFYEKQYNRLDNGDYIHKTFKFDPALLFSVKGAVDEWFEPTGSNATKE